MSRTYRLTFILVWHVGTLLSFVAYPAPYLYVGFPCWGSWTVRCRTMIHICCGELSFVDILYIDVWSYMDIRWPCITSLDLDMLTTTCEVVVIFSRYITFYVFQFMFHILGIDVSTCVRTLIICIYSACLSVICFCYYSHVVIEGVGWRLGGMFVCGE